MLITLVLAFAASTTSSRCLPAWLAIRHVSGVQDGNGKFCGIYDKSTDPNHGRYGPLS
jgi:hypothetical protein